MASSTVSNCVCLCVCVNAEDIRSHLESIIDLLSPEDSIKVVRTPLFTVDFVIHT